MSNELSGFAKAGDGTSIFYQIEDGGHDNWIVLSNSLATDIRVWDLQVEQLLKTRNVLRYDPRGHGKSEGTKAPYSFDLLTRDLASLMDHLSIHTADIMGISLGGMTALAMGIFYPQRINRIICCDARADAPDPYKAIWDANIEQLQNGGIDGICEPTLARWFTPQFLENPENAPLLDKVRAMIKATSNDGYEGVARCLQSLDLLKHLGGLKHETLFITGSEDMAAPVAVMQAMSELVSGSEFVVIEDAAHLSNLQQPGQFNKAMTAFLK